MASTRIRTTKDGQTFYEIRVSRGRSRSYLTTRWYPPAGWSQKAIDRALTKEAAEFERRCPEGEVTSRAEQKENDLRQKQEIAKIQTLRQYGEKVFMPAKTVTMSENGRCGYQAFSTRPEWGISSGRDCPDNRIDRFHSWSLSWQA